MRTQLRRLSILAILAACGGTQRVERRESKSYSERMAEAAQHDREAAAHEQAAQESSRALGPADVRCGNPVVGAVADQSTSGGERISTWVPCWTVERQAAAHHRAEAAEARRQAAYDRGVARNLVAVEREFCRMLPPDELTHTPFFHREDIATVKPYTEDGAVKGARIRFKPVEGLDANWMRQAILCHQARSATLGHDPAYLAYDPTLLGSVNVAVTEHGGSVEVMVRASEQTIAAVVLSRAQALLEPRPPTPPPPPPARPTH